MFISIYIVQVLYKSKILNYEEVPEVYTDVCIILSIIIFLTKDYNNNYFRESDVDFMNNTDLKNSIIIIIMYIIIVATNYSH